MGLTLPVQAPIFKKSDFEDEGLTLFNQTMTAFAQAINSALGHAGPVVLRSGLDLNGNAITNTGAPRTPSDVVTLEYAQQNYGAGAIQPQLEATSATPLQTYRQLNSKVQRENYSTFLQGILNTAPTANTSELSSAPPGGGFVSVTVSSGFLQHVDGSQLPYASRTDSFPLATAYTITSLTRAAGVVTAVLGSAFTGVVGQQIQITGPIAAEWQGIFIVGSPIVGSTIVYSQPGANDSESGGILTYLDTYYYTLSRGQNVLGLIGPVSADTWSNRVGGSFDGSTIVAVVIITSSGIDPINSAAGASLPVTGASIPVIRRL